MATVKQLRKAKRWSQQTLASAAGVGIQTIIKIEQDRPVLPSIKRAVCQALGTNDVEIVVYNRVQSDPISK